MPSSLVYLRPLARTIALLLVLPFLEARAQPQSEGMTRANALLGSRKFDSAASVLASIILAEPRNPRARMALGAAQSGMGQLELASSTYRNIISEFPQIAPRAAQSLFLMYAAADRRDDAYHWLGAIRNVIDLTGVASNAEVLKLTGDTRFDMLFPARLTYDSPFAEGTRIIHEWRGDSAGAEFGWIARPVGDVDHDGVTDVVISAPAHAPLGGQAGAIFVYSGKTGRLLWKRAGAANALLGTGLEGAGDVNGDGVPDVIAGAPGTGDAYVFSGTDGSVLLELHGEATEYYFGASVAGVGDMNGDGRADVIVGAPYSAAKGRATGRAIIFSGKDGSRLLAVDGEGPGELYGSAVAGGGAHRFAVGAPGGGTSHTGRVYSYDTLSRTPAFTADAAGGGVQLGAMFVSVVGDVDRDGVPDIYATDFADGSHAIGAGRVYVYSGKTGATLLDLPGDVANEGFGIGGARTGDINGDGIPDLVIGSWQYSANAWSGGRVRVLSGKDGRVLQSITGKIPGETLGFDAIGVGDIDGDGLADYLVTSAYSMVNGIRSGRAFIVAGTVRRQ